MLGVRSGSAQVKPPTDVRTATFAQKTEFPGGYHVVFVHNLERNWPPCRVYWGSHGCARPRGHEGAHWCDCCECDSHPQEGEGCVAGPPYYGPDTRFYGEDVPGKERMHMEIEIT